MKQKFTISIADIEMNILSEGTSEEVAATVNKVDRRIREICLRSPRISKNEAALLCALEFCSERDAAQSELCSTGNDSEELREENAKLADALEKLTIKLEAMKEKYETAAAAQKERYETAAATQKEKYEGRIEIMKEKYEGRINSLRARLDEQKKAEAAARQATNQTPDQPKTGEKDTPPKEETAQIASPSADDKKEPRSKGKNKVGSMFDLLTFNDV